LIRKEIPPVFDVEAMIEHFEWLYKMDKFGHGNVEITDRDIADKIKVSEAFFKFCLKYELKPAKVINTVIRDFVIRYNFGNSRYEQGILNRIKLLDIPEQYKKSILKEILGSELENE